MKEYYFAFITSAVSALPPIFASANASAKVDFLAETSFHELTISLFWIVSICFFVRGVVTLFPFPVFGETRIEFENAHPEAIGLDRGDRVRLYRVWRSKQKRADPVEAGQPAIRPELE